ncbi:hypothetical protein Sfulv_25970 [Streptomyces fulvorobeus]|uniref:Uncharacterized protein n=1 Tax=Streptomyces fulvorobeus TaxID=284028 RepID=A0A7J0C7R5_9ACTN|nr:hypothetical protein Sfulv_25970 [Streptomyces fulvorobeus]
MSQTHASPPSWDATIEKRRSRTGSPSALNIVAVRTDSSAVSGRSEKGGQHGATGDSSRGDAFVFDMRLC